MEEEKQYIDENIEYDAALVNKYSMSYIMEEEGIGADEAEPYDTQNTFNEDSFEDMNEDGEVFIEEVVEDDTNN